MKKEKHESKQANSRNYDYGAVSLWVVPDHHKIASRGTKKPQVAAGHNTPNEGQSRRAYAITVKVQISRKSEIHLIRR